MTCKPLTTHDILIDRRGNIVAAPMVYEGQDVFVRRYYIYERGTAKAIEVAEGEPAHYGIYEPVDALWQPVCQELSEQFSQKKQCNVDANYELMDRADAGDEEAQGAVRFLSAMRPMPKSRIADPITIKAPSYKVYSWGYTSPRSSCRECGEYFLRKSGSYRFCSASCRDKHKRANASQWARNNRPSRAKPKTERTCAHCGEVFTPKRSDARFCSAKCRVYTNRKAG
jgi:endogenous inhibitor of DNA gyrase (YacG/DUF329 family)